MRLRHLALFCLVASGCTGASGESRRPVANVATTMPDSINRSRPVRTIVDSALPLEEEVRRFRAGAPEVPAHFTGGARSRDALIRHWIRAIETRDSVALGRMLMNASEFITFYYPESSYTHPPYRQSPDVRWFLISNTSNQGITRVWRRHAGQALHVEGYTCNPTPQRIGKNRIWNNCTLRIRTERGGNPMRLFGPIIERDGYFKFLNYGSDY